MSKNIYWWVIGVLVVGGLGWLVFGQKSPTSTAVINRAAPRGPTAAPAASPTLRGEIVIGAILPLTGAGATYGLPIQKAIQLAVDKVNAARGADGKKLIVAYEDGKCDGKESATAAQKLIRVNKVQAIIGGVCSGETLGLAPIADEKKVVVISPSETSPDITTKGGEYVFRFAPSDALAGFAAAAYAKNELKAVRVAILSEQTDYAQGLRRAFREAFQKFGGVVAVDEAYNSGVTDFRTQGFKIKNANVDVVYVVPQTPAPGLAIIKAIRDQQLKAKVLTTVVLIGRDTARESRAVLEGVVGFEPLFNEKSERASEFIADYNSRYAEAPVFPFFMANAYSEVYLIKDLIEKDGNNGVKMHKTLATMIKGWVGGALADVTLDKNGDIEWKSYGVNEIKDGAVVQKSVISL